MVVPTSGTKEYLEYYLDSTFLFTSRRKPLLAPNPASIFYLSEQWGIKEDRDRDDNNTPKWHTTAYSSPNDQPQ